MVVSETQCKAKGYLLASLPPLYRSTGPVCIEGGRVINILQENLCLICCKEHFKDIFKLVISVVFLVLNI